MTAVSKEDPFAGKGDNVTPITKKPASDEDAGTGVSLTLKGGTGFDSPWIVARYASIEDAHADITDELVQSQLKELFTAVADASGAFIKSVSAVAPAKAAAPAGPAAPARPSGVGDDWQYKEGFSKQGKPWRAWMPPRGSDASPIWL